MLFALQLVDVLGFGSVLAVCIGMLYLASRIEPHWVSKDGQRFICNGQVMDRHGLPRTAWREYRVEVRWDGSIATRRRSRWVRADARLWRMQARSDDPPKSKAVYLFGPDRRTAGDRGGPPDRADDLMAVRLPVKSRAIAVLDGLVRDPYPDVD